MVTNNDCDFSDVISWLGSEVGICEEDSYSLVNRVSIVF